MGLFVLGCAAYASLGLSWLWFILLLFAPDLGAIGYLAGPRVGAVTYNVTHHKGLAILFYVLGVYTASVPLVVAGIIMFAHSSLDRALGFGLKYPDAFQHTHLGWIGKQASQS